MTNAEWVLKMPDMTLVKYYTSAWKWHTGKDDVAEYVEWLDAQHADPVLTDGEKEYLKAVVEPFKEKIKYICKQADPDFYDMEFVGGALKDMRDGDFELPNFLSGSRFREMDLDAEYTLEELGL